MLPEVVWDGRGPLTEWPEVDWFVLLQDDSWQPIWSNPPRTSAELWSRRMGSRFHNPHDDHRSFLRTLPVLDNEDQQKGFDRYWAQMYRLVHPQSDDVDAAAARVIHQPQPSAQKATSDDVIAEIAHVETVQRDLGREEPITLCSNTNKVKHRTKLWALHHRNRLAASADEYHPERLHAYKCRWCGSWHVGHKIAA